LKQLKAINLAAMSIMNPSVDVRKCFPLREADAYFPRSKGRRVSLPTLYRWATSGVRGVRLQTIRLGQTRCTSEVWVMQFIAELNADREEAVQSIRPAEQELIRRTAINDELDAAGL
jgi:hypothetical protein